MTSYLMMIVKSVRAADVRIQNKDVSLGCSLMRKLMFGMPTYLFDLFRFDTLCISYLVIFIHSTLLLEVFIIYL